MRPYLQAILAVLATDNIPLRLEQWEILAQPSHEPLQGRTQPIPTYSFHTKASQEFSF